MIKTLKIPSGIIFGITFFALIVTDCRKTETFDDAVITGYDARDCVCCGGLMINFNNDPIPYSGEFYIINELPDKPEINSSSKFPLYVRITWKLNNKVCGSANFIDILKLIIR